MIVTDIFGAYLIIAPFGIVYKLCIDLNRFSGSQREDRADRIDQHFRLLDKGKIAQSLNRLWVNRQI